MAKEYWQTIRDSRARKRQIKRWEAQGVSYAEIGRRIGTSRQRARELAKANGK